MQFKGHSQTSTAARTGLKWLAAMTVLVVLVGLCAVTAYASQPNISKVDVKDMGAYVQIAVSSDSALAVHDSRLANRYLVFDMYGRLAPREQKRVDIGAGGIKSVRCAWYQDAPPTARIAIGVTKGNQYSISAHKGQRLTIIKIAKQGVQPVPAVKSAPAEKPVPGGGVDSAVTAAAAAPAVVAQAKPEKLVSLDFVASDIHDVLKALGLQGGVNIVASADVKGNITVSLNKVTVEEALKLVANLSGFKYQFVDGTYIVGTADNVRAIAAGAGAGDDRVTEIVTLTYADPTVVSKMLEKQFPGMSVTSSAPAVAGKEANGPSVLVLSGSSSVVLPAKDLAQGIENGMAEKAQDMVSEFYEVKYADINELSAMVSAVVAGVRVSIGPTAGFNLKRPDAVAMGANDQTANNAAEQKAPSKMLLLQGPSLEVEKAKGIMAKLDVSPPQIMLEAKIVDISDTGKDDLGIQWGDPDAGLTGTRFSESTSGDALTIGRFSRSGLVIDATIRGLVQSGKGKVLASPNVLAIDGKPASAFIGDEVKYVIQMSESNVGGITVTTETARVGVQLHAVSRISQDGTITMNLHPEVSVITGWKDFPKASVSLPLIARRYVDSTVRVKDGETIVIGGLIKDEEIKSMSGVPFLKDLPFIGSLFRSKSTQKSHSEIMMFITPRVLTDSK